MGAAGTGTAGDGADAPAPPATPIRQLNPMPAASRI